MTVSQDLTTDKSIAELDQIIQAATNRKAQLYDAELDRLVSEIEDKCETLSLTLPQLLAIYKKRKRKTRAHKDNGGTED